MASVSKLDTVYRSVMLSKFFIKGWGTPSNLKRIFEFRKIMSNRSKCMKLVPSDYPVYIEKVEDCQQYSVLEGHFTSPLVHYLPEVVPKEIEIARFQILLSKTRAANNLRPICLHMAGTGDHYFWRRRHLLGKPLLKDGISSIILENPFYGLRKPKVQSGSSLHNVSDLFVMGGCLILEALALFHWCEREGYGPLGLTGISMGGHMASIAGCNWHKPVALIPCLSWTTASCVFTQGVMSGAIPWSLLQNQYFSNQAYREELHSMIHSPEENDAFIAGYNFSRDYKSSLEQTSHFESNKVVLNYINNVIEESSSNSSISSEQQVSLAASLANAELQKTTVASKPRSEREAIDFMRGIMDECTHLANFNAPVDPSLAIIVTAKKDGYVPRDGIKALPDLWRGCEVRYLDCGHIQAFLFNQGIFRKAIVDALQKTAEKYY